MRQPSLRPSRVAAVVALVMAYVMVLSGMTGCNRVPTAEGTEKKTGKGLVIGWSQRALTGSDWYKTLVEGGREHAKQMGARMEVLDAGGDTIRQIQDVNTLIAKDVDVVIMNANDPIGVAAAAKNLKKAGIPLITVNSNLDPSLLRYLYCYVAEDQVTTAKRAGRQIALEAVKKWGPKEKIKLVGIGGNPGDVISELRYKGFMSGYRGVMRDHPGIKTEALPFRYGRWLPDQALGPMRDVASANPDLKIVFSESDVMQAGIQQALKQTGVWGDGMLEATYDGGMNTVKQMLDAPSGPLRANASNQPWDQGATAVDMALAAYNGSANACPKKTRYVDTTLVTPKNAEQYYRPADTYVRSTKGR